MMSKITEQDLQAIIRMFNDSDWKELEISYKGCDVFFSKDSQGKPSWSLASPGQTVNSGVVPAQSNSGNQPADSVTTSVSSDKAEKAARPVRPGCQVIEAPSLGTFYRAAKPGAAPFVDLGQQIEADTELCLIEVMKLFTTLRAGINGKIVEILAADGELVEHGQPLFLVDTSE